MEHLTSVLSLFPPRISNELNREIESQQCIPEEIRVRRGQAVCMRAAGREYLCRNSVITEKDIRHTLLNATNGSYHSAAECLQNGFLPLPYGSRMGVCGEGTGGDGAIRNIRNISSLCIRIANSAYGCSDEIFPMIAEPEYHNTIIIAPPGAGKTTLLRELIRRLSYEGHYVCAADERGEISGMYRGTAAFDLGPRCDIASGIPKQHAAMMLLRAMAPEILAMDEITASRDTAAVMEAVGCGVGLLTTVHGKSVRDLMKPNFLSIYETGAFERAVVIRVENGRRYYEVEELTC